MSGIISENLINKIMIKFTFNILLQYKSWIINLIISSYFNKFNQFHCQTIHTTKEETP